MRLGTGVAAPRTLESIEESDALQLAEPTRRTGHSNNGSVVRRFGRPCAAFRDSTGGSSLIASSAAIR